MVSITEHQASAGWQGCLARATTPSLRMCSSSQHTLGNPRHARQAKDALVVVKDSRSISSVLGCSRF